MGEEASQQLPFQSLTQFIPSFPPLPLPSLFHLPLPSISIHLMILILLNRLPFLYPLLLSTVFFSSYLPSSHITISFTSSFSFSSFPSFHFYPPHDPCPAESSLLSLSSPSIYYIFFFLPSLLLQPTCAPTQTPST